MQAVIDYLHRNTIPLVSTALAAVLALAFWRLGPLVPYLLFLGAVVVSAWWGGFRPGLLAIVLASVLLALMYRNMARGTPADSPEQFLFRLAIMSGIAALAGMVGQQCRTATGVIDRVQDMLSGAGLGIIATDTQGRVVSVNGQAQALTGWTEEDARGLALADVLHVVEGSSARRRVGLPVESLLERPSRFDLPEGAILVGRGGQELTVDGSVASLAGGAGQPVGVVATFRDAGGRVKTLLELREAAERSQALVAQAAAPLLLLDDDGRCTFANGPSQQTLGCTAEECQGEGWARHLQRQDRARLFAEAPPALRKGQPFAMELRVQHPRSGLRWLRLATTPVAAPGGAAVGGGLLGHSVALEDLSPLKEAEAQVQEQARLTDAVLEAVEDPVLIKNHLGAPVAMNAAARTLLGVEEGVTGSEALAFDDSHRLTEAERNARATRQRQTADLTVSDDVGSRLFQAVAVPRSDDKGDVVGTVNVLREVTGAKQKDQDLKEAATRLQAVVENVPGFFYLKDEDGRYVLANRGFEELAGCEAGAWQGLGADEVLPGPLAAALRKHEKGVTAESATRQAVEALPLGDERASYLVRRFRVEAGDGRTLQGALGVDLTGQRRAVEETRAARDELAERLKEQEARQRESEEASQRLLQEVQVQLESAQAGRRRAEEALARAQHEGQGRAELQRLLDEARAARARAEEELRRQTEEHAEALREGQQERKRIEEEGRRVRQDLQRQLEEAVAARLVAESSLEQARRELGGRLRDAVQARDDAEGALRRAASESLSEHGRLMAGHFHVSEQLGSAREEVQRLLAEQEGKRFFSEEEWRKREEELQAGRLDLEARLRAAQEGQGLAERSLRFAAGESLAEHARLMGGQVRTGEELEGVRGELQALLARTHGKRLLSEEEWQALLAERDGEWARKLDELRRRLEESEAARQRLEGVEASLRPQLARAAAELEAARGELQAHLAGAQGKRLVSEEEWQALLAERDREWARKLDELRRRLEQAEAARLGLEGQEAALRQQLEDARRAHHEAEAAWQAERDRLAGEGEAVRRGALVEGEQVAKLREELAGVGQALDAVRQEKEFLSGVLDGLPEAVAAYDGAGRCRVWNAVMERWSGTARGSVLEQPGMGGFPAGVAGVVQSGLQAALAGGSRRVALDGPRIEGGDGQRPAEAWHVPVRTETGARIGGMAVVRARMRSASAPVPPASPGESPALVGAARPEGKNGNGTSEGRKKGDPNRVPSPDDPDWLSFN